MKCNYIKLLLPMLCCALFLQSQNIASFRFALLTDLHISPNNPQPSQDLQITVADLNNQTGIAFVLVTGDITEVGDTKSLQDAKKMLDKLTVPYYIIPGNHDTKWTESGATAFKKIFGDDKFRLAFNGYIFLGFNTGPILKMGDGHVAPQDLTWLKNQYKNIGKKMPVFLVTHYPLKNGDVDNWFEVTDIARNYNTQAVLGGHYHRNMVFDYDGIQGVLHRSTLRAKEPTGGYSIYDIRDSIYISEKRIGMQPVQWHALPIGTKRYFEPDMTLFPRPDYAVNKTFDNVKQVWVKSLGAGIYGSPAVADGRLFFGDDKGVFKALDTDNGDQIWRYQTGERIACTPAVSDNKVVFGSCDQHIYCLDVTTGALVWRVATSAAVLGSPVIDDGIVYIGASDGKFRAIGLNDGIVKWSFDSLKNYVETRPVIADGKVIFGAWDTNLYALNSADGSVAWRWNNGHGRAHFSPAAVWPVVAHGKVFIAAPDRYLTAVDLSSGMTVWRTNAHTVRETVGISADGNTIYSRCMTDSVVAISAQSNEPHVLWKINARYGYDHNACMPIENSGQIVFATKNGEITALNALSGEIIWKHKIGNAIINTLVPLSARDWVLTTTDGIVARISL